MANPREIRRRIRAVQSTRQITRAMELVARTKMYRTQQQARAARPYSEVLTQMLRRLVAGGAAREFESPLLKRRPVHRVLMMCFSADRGLCGGYNANVLKRAERQMRDVMQSAEVDLVTVGRRGRDYFRWRDVDLYDEFINIGEEADTGLARSLARTATREFSAGRVDEVQLVYTQFVSVFSHPVEVFRLLPLEAPEDDGRAASGLYLHEPSAESIFSELLPRFVENSMFRVLTQAKAAEHAARVTAMKSATDNAGELIEELTRQYNRARQTVITSEITEIASGAEALARRQ
ncbi:MAG: ATP synthase F1 subunit gamma [Bacillota bacterium]